MDLLSMKILAMVIMVTFSIILGLIPIKLSHFLGWSEEGKKKNIFTSILLCFGGGVLFATSFIHIIPEVRDGLLHSGENGRLPLTEILVCSGFFLVYFIEELVSLVASWSGTNLIDQSSSGGLQRHVSALAIVTSSAAVLEDETRHHPSATDAGRTTSPAEESSTDLPLGNDDFNPKYAGRLADTTKSMFPNYHSPEIVPPTKIRKRNLRLRDFLAVLALSLHDIFEGLVVGVENNQEALWRIFGAIATHKFIITFCVGLELVSVKTPPLFFYLYVLTFALMSPLGIGIGIAITETLSEDRFLLVSILQGLAAGTILYVVVFEVLLRERSRPSVPGLLQLFSIVVGFASMLIIEIFGGHLHNHHGLNNSNNRETEFYNIINETLKNDSVIIN